MPRNFDRGIARRAVNAWALRTLPGRPLLRVSDLLNAPTLHAWKAHRGLRKCLTGAIVAARVDEAGFCRNMAPGMLLLTTRLRATSEAVIVARIRELQEKVAGDDQLTQRYGRFISAVVDLLNPESDEAGKLLGEICLELRLRGRRLPWVRRQ